MRPLVPNGDEKNDEEDENEDEEEGEDDDYNDYDDDDDNDDNYEWTGEDYNGAAAGKFTDMSSRPSNSDQFSPPYSGSSRSRSSASDAFSTVQSTINSATQQSQALQKKKQQQSPDDRNSELSNSPAANNRPALGTVNIGTVVATKARMTRVARHKRHGHRHQPFSESAVPVPVPVPTPQQQKQKQMQQQDQDLELKIAPPPLHYSRHSGPGGAAAVELERPVYQGINTEDQHQMMVTAVDNMNMFGNAIHGGISAFNDAQRTTMPGGGLVSEDYGGGARAGSGRITGRPLSRGTSGRRIGSAATSLMQNGEAEGNYESESQRQAQMQAQLQLRVQQNQMRIQAEAEAQAEKMLQQRRQQELQVQRQITMSQMSAQMRAQSQFAADLYGAPTLNQAYRDTQHQNLVQMMQQHAPSPSQSQSQVDNYSSSRYGPMASSNDSVISMGSESSNYQPQQRDPRDQNSIMRGTDASVSTSRRSLANSSAAGRSAVQSVRPKF